MREVVCDPIKVCLFSRTQELTGADLPFTTQQDSGNAREHRRSPCYPSPSISLTCRICHIRARKRERVSKWMTSKRQQEENWSGCNPLRRYQEPGENKTSYPEGPQHLTHTSCASPPPTNMSLLFQMGRWPHICCALVPTAVIEGKINETSLLHSHFMNVMQADFYK